jgi:hypothetical protein
MKRLISIGFILFLAMQIGVAQTTYSGKVTLKKDGSPISGATVKVKGKMLSTTTGADGSYTITVPAEVNVMEATANGMNTVTQGVGLKSTVNFQLTSLDDKKGMKEFKKQEKKRIKEEKKKNKGK